MGISRLQWLLALLGAVALHLILLMCVWLARTPVQPPQHKPRGVMVSLDNLDAGPPPPPASIQDMPIENVQPNNTIGKIAEASAPSPDTAESPAVSEPEAAPTVGPESSGKPASATSGAPATAAKSGSGTAAAAAIAAAVTIHPTDTLEDIRPQQEVTAKQADLGTPGSGESQTLHNGAYGDSEQATDAYIVRLRAWLSRHKQYPKAARQNKTEGTVRLYLIVDRSGHVIAQHIEKSSGSTLLDQAAEQMLAHSEPLPSMPAAMQRNRLELVVPIVFTLK